MAVGSGIAAGVVPGWDRAVKRGGKTRLPTPIQSLVMVEERACIAKMGRVPFSPQIRSIPSLLGWTNRYPLIFRGS